MLVGQSDDHDLMPDALFIFLIGRGVLHDRVSFSKYVELSVHSLIMFVSSWACMSKSTHIGKPRKQDRQLGIQLVSKLYIYRLGIARAGRHK